MRQLAVNSLEFGVFPSLRKKKLLSLSAIATAKTVIARHSLSRLLGKAISFLKSDCFSSHKPGFAMTTALAEKSFPFVIYNLIENRNAKGFKIPACAGKTTLCLEHALISTDKAVISTALTEKSFPFVIPNSIGNRNASSFKIPACAGKTTLLSKRTVISTVSEKSLNLVEKISRLRCTSLEMTTLIILFSLFSFSANAKILLPQILSSDMVLQRDKPINIWGFASPNEKVEVTFAGQKKQVITNEKGNWSVVLSPLKTSAKPQTMTISGANKIELTNILVGEVWVCSGQSNMVYEMRKLVKIPKPKNEALSFPSDEVAKAHNQQIRIFLVNRKQLTKPDSIHKSWAVAQDSALRAFSAAGYFFAKEVQEKLGVPVGMICSAVSGSAIEPWISPEAFAQEPFFKTQKVSNDPGKFYTPMIEPLSKFNIRGVLWYQGETNCFLNEDISYAYKMKTLINLWRKTWGEQLPFYYVQIAPFDYSKQKSDKVVLTADTEPKFWEAQQQILRMPKTGMISTSDLNDNGDDLHPTYKWEVGRRLALLALAKTYNKDIPFSGPVYQSASFKNGKAVLTFQNLELNNEPITGFTIAGKDGKFVDADAIVKDGKVVVSAKGIATPTAVRYNWTESPTGNFSTYGLPALPFRTDNPLTAQFKPN